MLPALKSAQTGSTKGGQFCRVMGMGIQQTSLLRELMANGPVSAWVSGASEKHVQMGGMWDSLVCTRGAGGAAPHLVDWKGYNESKW